MSWHPELDELARREALAAQMGGPDLGVPTSEVLANLKSPDA